MSSEAFTVATPKVFRVSSASDAPRSAEASRSGKSSRLPRRNAFAPVSSRATSPRTNAATSASSSESLDRINSDVTETELSPHGATTATESTFLTPSASASLFAHRRRMSRAEACSWSYVTTPTSGSAHRRMESAPLTASLSRTSLCHRRRSVASRAGPDGIGVDRRRLGSAPTPAAAASTARASRRKVRPSTSPRSSAAIASCARASASSASRAASSASTSRSRAVFSTRRGDSPSSSPSRRNATPSRNSASRLRRDGFEPRPLRYQTAASSTLPCSAHSKPRLYMAGKYALSNLSASRKCCSASSARARDHSTTPMFAMASTLSGSSSSAVRYFSTARLGNPRLRSRFPSFTIEGACFACTARHRPKQSSASFMSPSRAYSMPRLKCASIARRRAAVDALNQRLASDARPFSASHNPSAYIAL